MSRNNHDPSTKSDQQSYSSDAQEKHQEGLTTRQFVGRTLLLAAAGAGLLVWVAYGCEPKQDAH